MMKLVERLRHGWGKQPPEAPGERAWDRFLRLAKDTRPASVLEVGTLQSKPGWPTHQFASFPWVRREDYVMADVQAGPDVDVVADLHALPAAWAGRFDAFLALAVFEHLERPWIAAREVARVLAPGGIFMVGTHQTFPLHGFPQDFFRFSKEALALIFQDAGLEVIESVYEDRCLIVPPTNIIAPRYLDMWNEGFPSYILVHAIGRKPA